MLKTGEMFNMFYMFNFLGELSTWVLHGRFPQKIEHIEHIEHFPCFKHFFEHGQKRLNILSILRISDFYTIFSSVLGPPLAPSQIPSDWIPVPAPPLSPLPLPLFLSPTASRVFGEREGGGGTRTKQSKKWCVRLAKARLMRPPKSLQPCQITVKLNRVFFSAVSSKPVYLAVVSLASGNARKQLLLRKREKEIEREGGKT